MEKVEKVEKVKKEENESTTKAGNKKERFECVVLNCSRNRIHGKAERKMQDFEAEKTNKEKDNADKKQRPVDSSRKGRVASQ